MSADADEFGTESQGEVHSAFSESHLTLNPEDHNSFVTLGLLQLQQKGDFLSSYQLLSYSSTFHSGCNSALVL